LLSQLDIKERLANWAGTIKQKCPKAAELESLIAAKEATMKKTEETLSNALK
jgi:hypothetical protein